MRHLAEARSSKLSCYAARPSKVQRERAQSFVTETVVAAHFIEFCRILFCTQYVDIGIGKGMLVCLCIYLNVVPYIYIYPCIYRHGLLYVYIYKDR